MAYDGVVMLQVLLDGVGADIQPYEYPEFIPEQEAAVDEERAGQEQQDDQERRLFLFPYKFIHKITSFIWEPVVSGFFYFRRHGAVPSRSPGGFSGSSSPVSGRQRTIGWMRSW